MITFLTGHPVPYSVTVQRNGVSIGARPYIDAFRAHMRECYGHEPAITKIDVAAIDVGFDVRAQDMAVAPQHAQSLCLAVAQTPDRARRFVHRLARRQT